jgi:hypothetical protein
VFGNRVLRRIFGAERYEVIGEWRRLHNEELYDRCSPNIIPVIRQRRVRLAGHVACVGVRRSSCRVVVGKSDRKRPFESPRCRWADNDIVDVKRSRMRSMDWIDPVQDSDRG